MPNKKKKKYNSRFPPTRIKRIMQTDEDVGKVAAAVPVIISRALELFVESLIKNASQITRARNAKTLTTTHLKQCILAENKFDFLKDLVASVPDVQGDDESSSTPPPPQQTSVSGSRRLVDAAVHKYKRVSRVRKFSRTNAGPSQLDEDEDDEDDDDDEDDESEEEDEDEEDEDEDGSEDSLSATKGHPSCTNHKSILTSGRRTSTMAAPPPNGTQTSAAINPSASHVFNLTGARCSAQLDEDYDS